MSLVEAQDTPGDRVRAIVHLRERVDPQAAAAAVPLAAGATAEAPVVSLVPSVPVSARAGVAKATPARRKAVEGRME